MPNLKASIKDVRKSQRRKTRNLQHKNDAKKTIKEFMAAVSSGDKEKAGDILSKIYKIIDKMVKRNIIHKNTAARRKSKLTKMLTK